MFFDMNADKTQIIKLWNEAFGDSEEEINEFLNIFGDCIHTISDNNLIVSQLFLIPGKINSAKAYYLYAAATLEEYRGRGFMSKLLKYAETFAKENNAEYILLMPGEDSLYDYYERFGYKSLCFCRECIFEKDDIPQIVFDESKKYSHDNRVYKYAESAYGGCMNIFKNNDDCLIYDIISDCAFIKEWHSDDISSLLKTFSDAVKIKQISISLPSNVETAEKFEIKRHGMILPLKGLCNGSYYLDYVLD